MKKRLLALALAVGLTAAVAIPSFATYSDPTWYGEATISSNTSFNVNDYNIPNNLRMDVHSFSSFATVKSTDQKMSWKAIDKAKIGIDGTMDISKVIATNGADKVVFSYAALETSKKATMGSLPTDTVYFALKEAQDKPDLKTPAVSESYAEGYLDIKAVWPIDKAKTYEYAEKNGTVWTEWNGEFGLAPVKQEYLVRLAATATNGPSPAVKISVPALAAPPALKVDMAKGTIALKTGMYINTETNSTGTSISGAKPVFVIGSKTSLTAAGGTFVPGDTIYVRTATGTKPGSGWTVIAIPGEQASSPHASDFAVDDKGVNVVGTKIIQVYDASASKWVALKSYKGKDFKGVDNALIRTAGNKFQFASDALYLDITAKGVITVSEDK